MLYIDECKHWIFNAPEKNQKLNLKMEKKKPVQGLEPVTPGILE